MSGEMWRRCDEFEDLVTIWLHDRAGMLGLVRDHVRQCERCASNRAWVERHERDRWIVVCQAQAADV